MTYRSIIGRLSRSVEGERDRVARPGRGSSASSCPGRPAAPPARCRCGRTSSWRSRTPARPTLGPAGTSGAGPTGVGARRDPGRVDRGPLRQRPAESRRPPARRRPPRRGQEPPPLLAEVASSSLGARPVPSARRRPRPGPIRSSWPAAGTPAARPPSRDGNTQNASARRRGSARPPRRPRRTPRCRPARPQPPGRRAPRPARRTASSTAVPVSRAALSCAPKSRMANCLTGSGHLVDHHPADRHQRRRPGSGQDRHQLAHRQRDGGGGHAGQRAVPPRHRRSSTQDIDDAGGCD